RDTAAEVDVDFDAVVLSARDRVELPASDFLSMDSLSRKVHSLRPLRDDRSGGDGVRSHRSPLRAISASADGRRSGVAHQRAGAEDAAAIFYAAEGDVGGPGRAGAGSHFPSGRMADLGPARNRARGRRADV